MTAREHVVGCLGLAVAAGAAAWIISSDGLGHFAWLLWIGLLTWSAVKLAGYVAEVMFGAGRLQRLRELAHAIGREHGVAVAVLPTEGHRYTVTAQHWRFGPEGAEDAFATVGGHLDEEQARAYLEGLSDGHELADWRANHPHDRRNK